MGLRIPAASRSSNSRAAMAFKINGGSGVFFHPTMAALSQPSHFNRTDRAQPISDRWLPIFLRSSHGIRKPTTAAASPSSPTAAAGVDAMAKSGEQKIRRAITTKQQYSILFVSSLSSAISGPSIWTVNEGRDLHQRARSDHPANREIPKFKNPSDSKDPLQLRGGINMSHGTKPVATNLSRQITFQPAKQQLHQGNPSRAQILLNHLLPLRSVYVALQSVELVERSPLVLSTDRRQLSIAQFH
ncbi:hypothetical protein ACLOJK_033858 [Asimina triloba]